MSVAEISLSPSYRERLFHILRGNLVCERPEYADREVILCPLCLRDLRFDDVRSVEHILPENALKDDPLFVRQVSLSRRAGLTVLCRTSRAVGCGKDAPEGCNGWKGQAYDRLFKGMLAGQQIPPHKLTLRRKVAVLTMAYLAAFQRFGYGCILNDAFETVRCQADYPDRKMTPWLDSVVINPRQHALNGQVWATSSGLPFVFGWHGVKGSALEVYFRRFRVLLPGGHWLMHHDPDLLLPAVIAPPPEGYPK